MPSSIEDYAIVGDMQTSALISRAGSVDWLCLPRFDSDACFAALLGTDDHGSWQLAPVSGGTPTRRYAGDTLILETTWETATGTAVVTDFMPPRDGGQPTLIRIVDGVSGTVEMETVLRFRFGYGQVVPWVHAIPDGIRALAGPDSAWLSSPISLNGRGLSHEARFTVSAGGKVPFTLAYRESHLPEPMCPDPPPASPTPYSLLEETKKFWESWVRRCTYTGEYREAVIRSLITLKALTYQPTGGIVAAATTSLPEDLGGVRNWDYRYCWLRDATITLEALLRTGYTEEAEAWRRWLARAVAGDPADVQIMYGVAGERRLTEWEADWLPGYENSAPVRIGNAASGQFQLDVYGEVIDALYLSSKAGLKPDRHTWSLIRALLRYVEQHWDDPDDGLWEVRGGRRHFVHSKVMAWVAFDRGSELALVMEEPRLAASWRGFAERIRGQVLEQGYDAGRGAFVQSYGSGELDAAVLLIGETGFLPPDDPRFASTVDVLKSELMSGGFLRRYSAGEGSNVDGLPGSEGAFLACSFWLANALDLAGQKDEALALFEQLLSIRNDVGLLAEEFDPRYNRQVGNTPQAFSHVPLIQTALNLSSHAEHHRRRHAAEARLADDGRRTVSG
jgi:GH15 family glucan-1,4-alpha-glucosidase